MTQLSFVVLEKIKMLVHFKKMLKLSIKTVPLFLIESISMKALFIVSKVR